MPEVVQDETVTETSPVKVDKLNGAAKPEGDQLKENGSSLEEKKNGHSDIVKNSEVEANGTTLKTKVDTEADAQSAEIAANTAEESETKEEEANAESIDCDKKQTTDTVEPVNIESGDKKEVIDNNSAKVEESSKSNALNEVAETATKDPEAMEEPVSEVSPTDKESSECKSQIPEEVKSGDGAELCNTKPEEKTEKTEEGTKGDEMEVVSSSDAEGVKVSDNKSSLESKESDGKEDDVAAGGSKTSGIAIPEDIDTMITEGRACIAKNNFTGAADLLGQACEKLRELFGELDERCGTCYYYYGAAMLECAKTENSVLGEGVNKEESESESDEEDIPVVKEKEEGEQDGKKEEESKEDQEVKEEQEDKKTPEEEVEKMEEVKDEKADETLPEGSEEPSKDEAMETEEKDETGVEGPAGAEENTDITLNKEEEEEDTTLKAAWETLELAKFIFEKQNNVKMLADTYMKLGEVAVESGHKTGFDDMKKCLELRTKFYGGNHRALPETHFNIGLAYSLFELFDEAIEEFETSKKLLLDRIEMLEKSEGKEGKGEIEEIKGLVPDIDDKIKDMKESKEEKAKAESSMKGSGGEGGSGATSSGAEPKPAAPVSNLNHLVKRKRKIEEVAEELPEKVAKQPCVEPQAPDS